MTRTHVTYWRIAFALAIQTAIAQQCYYPNGAEAPEKPCGSAEGSACCPDKWQCLDNGLCYYPPDNLHGRYSCTDQSWKAEGCPSNMCTYDMSAFGGESITQCSDHNNDWCCNADAQHVDCCKESPEPRPFFALQDGNAYATIGASTASSVPNLATITGKALASEATSTGSPAASGSNSPQSTDAPNTSASVTADAVPTTSLQTSVSSGTAGFQTITRTVVIPPSSTASSSDPASSNSSKSSSNLPVIVGCAVGIPLVLALLGIVFWLLRKRSKQTKVNNRLSKPPFADDILADGASPDNGNGYGFAGGAKHNEKPPLTTYRSSGEIPELPGDSVVPTTPIPIPTINGRAELDSGADFEPSAHPAYGPPFVGLGGGAGPGHSPHSSWASAANRHSEALPSSVLAGYNEADSSPVSVSGQTTARRFSEMDGAGVGATMNSGPPPGGYIPYRPNTLVQPHQAQEMSSVTTPPAQELGVPSPPAQELGNSVRTPPA